MERDTSWDNPQLSDGDIPNKLNIAELMESEASKLLKREFAMLDELNQYLVMLSEMDNIDINRKLVLLENYIDNIKKNIQ